MPSPRLRLLALPPLLALAACHSPPPPEIVAIPVAPAAAPAPERRVVLTVPFRINSAELRPDARPVLDNLAAAMRDERLRGARFEVNGHTDLSGRFGQNVALSFLRADAVLRGLEARGVPPAGLRAQGFGPLMPLDPAQPLDPANRRVEVVAIGP